MYLCVAFNIAEVFQLHNCSSPSICLVLIIPPFSSRPFFPSSTVRGEAAAALVGRGSVLFLVAVVGGGGVIRV